MNFRLKKAIERNKKLNQKLNKKLKKIKNEKMETKKCKPKS